MKFEHITEISPYTVWKEIVVGWNVQAEIFSQNYLKLMPKLCKLEYFSCGLQKIFAVNKGVKSARM